MDAASNREDPASMAQRVGEVERSLVEHGLADGTEIARTGSGAPPGDELLDGARVVARAWRDRAFRGKLVTSPDDALADMGLSMGAGHEEGRELRVVENSPDVHNVIVCTLCSCYPRALLGAPPDWYTSKEYRSRVVVDPRGVLAEFGLELPPGTDIRVWDSTAEIRYMVLPQAPVDASERSEEELAHLVTPEALTGTALISG